MSYYDLGNVVTRDHRKTAGPILTTMPVPTERAIEKALPPPVSAEVPAQAETEVVPNQVITGDAKPITAPSTTPSTPWFLYGGIAVGVVGLVFLLRK